MSNPELFDLATRWAKAERPHLLQMGEEMRHDLAAFAEHAITSLKSFEGQGWISVDERLPDLKDVGNEWSYSEDVLTLSWVIEQDGSTYCKVAQCQKDPQGRSRWLGCKPFAWMPLPSAPALTKSANP